MTQKYLGAALTAVASLALAAPAWSHAGLQPAESPAGKPYRAVISIGHGCDGAPTQVVRVELPDGFYNAKPMPKPGWQLQVVTGPYARPFDNHGKQQVEGPRTIIWSGGTLEDGWYDEFVLRGVIGPEVAAGERLFFRTVQECGNARAEWTDTSGSHDVPNPAPYVTVTAAPAKADQTHADQPASHTLGDLTLTGAFSRATAPKAPVAGGFVSIANKGSTDDRLIAAQSPAAARVEIHEMRMDGDVMTMRELPEGLILPAGETVELKPGGYHLMFMELKQPFVEGETVPVTLTFENAGSIELPFAIGPVSARSAGAAAHDGHAGHSGH
ncbi:MULTISPECIES: copper chaperone PCu(A)C [unclassified Paracoccus (in: a-proteobacteria)]|uniref:copper chaperone PCu(A)C n=1 Tax=unclassified Paracoccus (in: a-proteobacteria) TaxID=2688777 RepID=UPI0012B336AC|nr:MULTISPECIES: copper chaperone PCu(A)C [unclassified Paracoccus (in: a-proteobacteria)]UXU76534.1 copper chaperone PCu(A)C [Paracoccus sp. SMMA_5]UXU82399.1 copper chaperone PCu(A)C [Paracoccus sp. SMMA_5_TC]